VSRRLTTIAVALALLACAAPASAGTGGVSPISPNTGGISPGRAPSALDSGVTPSGPPTAPVRPRRPTRPGPGARDVPRAYLRLYRAADRSTGVSWRLIAAAGKNESDHGRSRLPGVAGGLNSAGCCAGPMQICVVASCGNVWQAYGRDRSGDGQVSPYQPADAVFAAATILRDLKRTFGNHPALILAGYNAGPGNVQRYGGVPPFRETQAYVARGLAYMGALKRR
jgi:membrane-bound lytic murein transglycosylase B